MNDGETKTRTPILIVGAVVALIAAIWWYCGSGPSLASVSGQATLDGQPVAGARIIFVQIAEGDHQPGGLIALSDDAGKYQLRGPAGQGVPLGKYKVNVEKDALVDGTVPLGKALERARAQQQLVNILPALYAGAETPFQFEIVAGSNQIPLEMKKRP